MHLNAELTRTLQSKPERKDPSGFVMSMALVLFALTLVAVFTMQLALTYKWQIL